MIFADKFGSYVKTTSKRVMSEAVESIVSLTERYSRQLLAG